MAAAPPVGLLHAPGPGCCPPECPTRQTPDTRRCPPGHAPCPSVLPAHSTASSPTTTNLPIGAPSAVVPGENVASVAPARLLFFGVLGEIVRRRDLGQHAGDDLIRQALKGLMNTRFQISKLPRMVPQLGHPLPPLILQLLLHLTQDFVNVLHQGPTRSFDTHFHTPPAIHGVYLVCRLRKAYSIPKRL